MSAWEKKPEVIVFAGPNGSGKSTFTELFQENGKERSELKFPV